MDTRIDTLIAEVRNLEADPHVRKLVEERVADFMEVNKRDSAAWFLELVYCLLTAYSSAERAQLCVDALDGCDAIINGNTEDVAETLSREGHRFAEKRAEYIVAVRRLAGSIKQITQGFRTAGAAREWLVKNVTIDCHYSYMFTGEYDMYEFNLGHTFNYAEMAALIAPRPFMVERGHRDGVAPDEWVAYEYAKVRRRYADLKIPERTEIEFFDGPHEIHGVGTFRFLHKHLNWPEEPPARP